MIKPIKTEEENEKVLLEISNIFNAKKNTPEGDRLEILSLLVADFERKQYPMRKLTPIEALKVEMEEQGLTQSALAQRFGMSKSAVSEIMSGKKQMSVRFMKFLHNDLGIPAESLLSY